MVPSDRTGHSPQFSPSDPEATESAPSDPVSGKTVAEIFGEIVWLMTQDPDAQDPDAQDIPIKALERLVMPAILLKQFHITYCRAPIGFNSSGQPVTTESAPLQPTAVELFALCSADTAKTIAEQSDYLPTLRDWTSGPLRTRVRIFKSGTLS
ncbi:toxin-activating lysine-acyltransferase [Xanthobacter agilis]|uniref:toxin-activating lysine-acyltransferase n=1 Tax=Xanthobacter agilis TaxID=47492 RepID=UPI00372B96E9